MKQIHLIAPSGASLDASSPLIGIKSLEALGLDVLNSKCVDRIEQRFAGSDAQRLSELNQLATLNPEKLVMVMRGGYGLHRLLGDIDWLGIATNIKNGLQICGHSDFTVFQLALLLVRMIVVRQSPQIPLCGSIFKLQSINGL